MAAQDRASSASEGQSPSQSQSHYTHLLVGTSLALSVLSAALAQTPSNKILHVDPEEYYGSHNASLTLSQLAAFVGRKAGASIAFPYFAGQGQGQGDDVLPAALQKLDRHYSISISPALQPATSPSLDVLIRSQVAKYATFRLLQRTALWDADKAALRTVPCSKEDVFKTGELSLIEKRKLMKFLQFVADPSAPYTENETLYKPNAACPFSLFLGEAFKLPQHLVQAVMYGIALCPTDDEPTEPALRRLQTHLRSVGRYGNAAYLVPQYGGAGEIAQGYCRAAAVHGATFILGKPIEELKIHADGTPAAILKLQDIDETFTADAVLGEDELLPAELGAGLGKNPADTLVVQGILVLDRGVRFAPPATEAPGPGGEKVEDEAAPTPTPTDEPVETGLIVFSPGSLPLADGEAASSSSPTATNPSTVTALVLGEGTFCSPKGQYIVHVTAEMKSSDAALAREVFLAAKRRVLELARESPVEWRAQTQAQAGEEEEPGSSDAAAAAAYTQPIPLAEAFWVEDTTTPAPASAETSSDTSTSTPTPSVTRVQRSAPSSSSNAGLATLLDSSTAQAEALFYAQAGVRAPYPTTEEYLAWREERVRRRPGASRRKHRHRHPDEFKGRGGVGPEVESDSEGEDAGAKGEAGDADSEESDEMVFFFPPPLDDAGDAGGDGEA